MTEQELAQGCIAHRPKAQRELYDRYAPKMMALMLRYCASRDVAEDLLQEGFIKVYMAIATFTGVGSLEGWIRRVMVNTALEYLRRNDVMSQTEKVEEVVLEQSGSVSVVEELSAQELMNLIAKLPTGFRTVFNMFALEGYSHKEISEALGINESTSRSQFTRAKQLLQQKISKLYTP